MVEAKSAVACGLDSCQAVVLAMRDRSCIVIKLGYANRRRLAGGEPLRHRLRPLIPELQQQTRGDLSAWLHPGRERAPR